MLRAQLKAHSWERCSMPEEAPVRAAATGNPCQSNDTLEGLQPAGDWHGSKTSLWNCSLWSGLEHRKKASSDNWQIETVIHQPQPLALPAASPKGLGSTETNKKAETRKWRRRVFELKLSVGKWDERSKCLFHSLLH